MSATTNVQKALGLDGPEYRVFVWHLFSGALDERGSWMEGKLDRRSAKLKKLGLIEVEVDKKGDTLVRFTEKGKLAVTKYKLLAQTEHTIQE